MSVFTPLGPDEIHAFLTGFPVGNLIEWQGVPGGTENTNYFLECTRGSYVLTLVERGSAQDLPFLVSLLDTLHEAGLPVPHVIRDRAGRAVHELKGRPALLQPKLPGRHVESVTAEHCAAAGAWLAGMHQVTTASGLHRYPDRGPSWVLEQAAHNLDTCWRDDRVWLQPLLDELRPLVGHPGRLMPVAVLHGDLFRDNVLFDDTRISGVIDFHNAATGWMLLDLAICVNDWCIDTGPAGPQLNRRRLEATWRSYQCRRPLTEAERRHWPLIMQLAALRFWVSREQAAERHRHQSGVLVKDPEHFRQVLRLHRRSPVT